MKTKVYLSFILSLVVLVSCGKTKIDNKNSLKDSITVKVDTSNIAIIPFDSLLRFNQAIMNAGTVKSTKIEVEELILIEGVLRECIENYNMKKEKEFEEYNRKYPQDNRDKSDIIIELENYKRQYVAYINSKGEKEIWINCFCDTNIEYWRKEIVFVLDGGKCFFNLKIKIKKKEYYDFRVNGDA
jgi:hypothetical protein